jgi:hypothetical protein
MCEISTAGLSRKMKMRLQRARHDPRKTPKRAKVFVSFFKNKFFLERKNQRTFAYWYAR